MVRFDELAQMVNERVDPSDTDAVIYVGLEHLDSDTLKIRRWGTPSDVIGDKLRFQKGDIIFGRRRIPAEAGRCRVRWYLFSTRDGRARNTNTVDSEFLPFLMQSDLFMQRAIDISVGSLSPTINWKTLRIQEFPLPPKDEQRRIADLLWAADEANDAMIEVCEAATLARNTAHRELFNAELQDRSGRNEWKIKPIVEACEIVNNLRKPINATVRSEMQGSFPYYGPTGILDHINEYRVDGEYVLIGEDGDHFLKFLDWEMTQLVTGKFNVNNHAHILRGKPECRTRWVFQFFKHRDIRPYLAKQGAGRLKLKKATLEQMCLPVPPIGVQDRIIAMLDALDDGLSASKQHLSQQREMAKQLREQLLTLQTGEGM